MIVCNEYIYEGPMERSSPFLLELDCVLDGGLELCLELALDGGLDVSFEPSLESFLLDDELLRAAPVVGVKGTCFLKQRVILAKHKGRKCSPFQGNMFSLYN